MKSWHEIRNLMDIKDICIVAFTVFACANACADVAKLKTVTIVTNLVAQSSNITDPAYLPQIRTRTDMHIGRRQMRMWRFGLRCCIRGITLRKNRYMRD